MGIRTVRIELYLWRICHQSVEVASPWIFKGDKLWWDASGFGCPSLRHLKGIWFSESRCWACSETSITFIVSQMGHLKPEAPAITIHLWKGRSKYLRSAITYIPTDPRLLGILRTSKLLEKLLKPNKKLSSHSLLTILAKYALEGKLMEACHYYKWAVWYTNLLLRLSAQLMPEYKCFRSSM